MGKFIDKLKSLNFEDRAWKIAAITSFVNLALAVGKFVFGIALSSYYFCVIAVYGALVGLIKQRVIGGTKKPLTRLQETKRFIEGGAIMTAAGIFYTVYAARLLFYPENQSYNLIVSITIAAFGFASLGISIAGMIKARGKGLLLRKLKILSFSSALTNIVLVQIALMSASGGGEDYSKYNGYIGIGVGAIIICLALYIIITGIIEYRKALSANEKGANGDEIISAAVDN